MSTSQRSAVPAGVAAIGLVAIVIGIVQLVAGGLLVAFNGDVDGWSSSEALSIGIVTLLVGLAYVAVGAGLRRGSAIALTIGLLVTGFRAAYDLGYLVVAGLDGIAFGLLISLAINLVVFVVLYRGRTAFGLT